uniref:VQ domain-containing protein n=2 Tax=Kalanchoe fedtschenkoi TaxID=63787 RepID=A0A7N0ZXT3_KALFE
MDSNSCSVQSSSGGGGGEEESYDSRSIIHQHQQQPFLFQQHHHLLVPPPPSASSSSGPTSTAMMPNAFNQQLDHFPNHFFDPRNTTTSNVANLQEEPPPHLWPMTVRPDPADLLNTAMLSSSSSFHHRNLILPQLNETITRPTSTQATNSTVAAAGGGGGGLGGDQNPNGNANNPPAKARPKKRSRASRRAPTTVLTTDTSNFRAMVQEFTGIPAPPFATSSSSSLLFSGRSGRFDLFAGSSRNQEPTSSSSYLLRPFAQRPRPVVPPPPHQPLSSSAAVLAGINSSTAADFVNHHQTVASMPDYSTFTSLLQPAGPPLADADVSSSHFLHKYHQHQPRNEEAGAAQFRSNESCSSRGGGGCGGLDEFIVGLGQQVAANRQQQHHIATSSSYIDADNDAVTRLHGSSSSNQARLLQLDIDGRQVGFVGGETEGNNVSGGGGEGGMPQPHPWIIPTSD